jgi:hypothetical protein
MHSSNTSEVQPSQGEPIEQSDARSQQVHFAVAEHPREAFTGQRPKRPEADADADAESRVQKRDKPPCRGLVLYKTCFLHLSGGV